MPTTDTYLALMGTEPPAPNKVAFLKWRDDYLAKRRRQCQSVRTTKYFIDPVGGNDANAGTFALPYKSLAPIRTRIASDESGFAVYIKRGTTLYETVRTDIDVANIYIGSYGGLSSTAADRPIISNFTVQFRESANPWTLAAGNRYTASVPASGPDNPSGATSIGYLRLVADPFNPLRVVDSTAKVDAQPYSFFISGSTIHLNPGTGVDPNAFDYEATPFAASPHAGIRLLNGCDGVWLHDLRLDGFGCVTQSTVDAVSCIQNFSSGDDVVLITDCESYYGGKHHFTQENSGVGGVHIVERCTCGYLLPWSGANHFNTYSGNGGQEAIFNGCTVRFGFLPQDYAGAANLKLNFGGIQIGGAFYGHTGTVNDNCALYLNINCRSVDERLVYTRATTVADSFAFSEGASGFCPGTNADPTTWRVYIIGYKCNRIRTSETAPHMTLANRVHLINSEIYIRRSWTAGGVDQWFTTADLLGAHFTNCIFQFDDEASDANTVWGGSSASAVGPRLINCLMMIRGIDGGSGLCTQLALSHLRDKLRIGNTILVGENLFNVGATSGYGKRFAMARASGTNYPLNDSDCQRYNAILGCQVATSGNDIGFDACPGLVRLDTANNTIPTFSFPSLTRTVCDEWTGYVDSVSPLAAKGSTNPFSDKGDCLPAPEYDYFERPRPAVPAIGPFDVATMSGGGGIFGGGSGGTFTGGSGGVVG